MMNGLINAMFLILEKNEKVKKYNCGITYELMDYNETFDFCIIEHKSPAVLEYILCRMIRRKTAPKYELERIRIFSDRKKAEQAYKALTISNE